MPRNSSGNYSLPAGNPVVPNTLIETTWANPTMSDIGASLTDSLDRYGRGGMLAQLKLADGTLVQPAFAFNSESSTGLLRPSAGTLQVAVLGSLITTFAAAAVTFTQPPVYAADPVTGDQLTRKSYVDSLVTGGYLPLTGGTLSGPGNLVIAGTLAANGGVTLGNAAADPLAITSNAATIPNGLTISGGALAISGTFAANGGTTIGDASGDAFTINSNTVSIPNNLTVTGGTTAFAGPLIASGTFAANGGVTLGDAAGDAFTITSSSVSIPNSLGFTGGNVGFGAAPDAVARINVDSLNPTRGILGIFRNGLNTTGAQVIFAQSGVGNWAIGQPGATDAFAIWQNRTTAADGTQRFTIDAVGNVGIGTTSPVTLGGNIRVLEIMGLTATRGGGVALKSSDSSQSAVFYVADGLAFMGTRTAHPLTFTTTDVERMRIDASGNVGIGNSPGVRLDVTGAIRGNGQIQSNDGTVQTTYGAQQFTALAGGIGTVTNHPFVFGTNATERGRFLAAGSFLLGRTTDSGLGQFQVAGNADIAPSAGTANVHVRAVLGSTANVEISGNGLGGAFGLGIQHDGTNGQFNMRTVGALNFSVNSLLRFVMTSDGRLYGTGLHNNAGAVTGTTNQYIASGTYTATLTAALNVTSSSNLGTASWIRTGNVVHVYGRLQLTPTATGLTTLRISLPIASNFTTANDGGGTAINTLFAGAYITTGSTNDDMELNLTSPTTAVQTFNYHFQYVVL